MITVKTSEDTDKGLDSIHQKALDRLNDMTDEVITLREMNQEIK